MNVQQILKPVTETSARPAPTDQSYTLVRSYLQLRVLIGLTGMMLPVVLLGGDRLLLEADYSVRGSLSAYYHSGMRDFFVATLAVSGIFLVSYKISQVNLDNTLSILAGIAAFGVALLPTDFPEGVSGVPTPIQEQLGQTFTSTLHFGCAAVFIVCLGIMTFFFGKREGRRSGRSTMKLPPHVLKWIHYSCAAAIAAAILFILGSKVTGIFETHSVLVGESVAAFAFGVSWLLKGLELDVIFPPLNSWLVRRLTTKRT